MDGNLSSGNMISGAGGSFDLQNSMRVHHQQHNNPFTLHQHHLHQPQSNRQQIHPSIHENFPLRMGAIQEENTAMEYRGGSRRKYSNLQKKNVSGSVHT